MTARRRAWPWAVVAAAATGALLVGHAASPAGAPVAFAAPVGGGTVGDGRPDVGPYDGNLVRRCEAVALWGPDGAAGPALRIELHRTALAQGLTLLDLPVDAVSPTTLASGVPDVVGCLPPGAVLAAPVAGAVRAGHEPVLLHDLILAVRPAPGTAQAAAVALDREGVLTDLFGQHRIDAAGGAELLVHYVGPLLGSAQVDAARAAVARAAGTGPAAVDVRPGSPDGPGVTLALEPELAAPPPVGATHHH